MCELFAMSSRVPATVDLSLERLARHGGEEGPHRDGWGCAFYEGPDLFLVREPQPAAHSPLMRLLETQRRKGCMVLCHLRLASIGGRSLRNTQPFARELGGVMHSFAHNGDLHGIHARQSLLPGRFRPVGDSDSEWAFCALLERLAPLWIGAEGQVPSLTERLSAIAGFAEELRSLGTANFIYGDSTALFVHADRRTQLDGSMRAPGLYLLQRACWRPGPELAEAGISLATVRQDVALVASVPLTDELWRPIGEGEVLALQGGRCLDVLGRESSDYAARASGSPGRPCPGAD
jgi:predicted glutamine amidotransferase